MSTTKWTKEQQSAIDTRNCNLLVAAAAGSGKTAVLVERIIKIVTADENPVDIDKLLVVTFTSAAASEMRERIGIAIDKALENNKSSKVLLRQRALLGRAYITTMHSFCMDVIKNNYHVIDMDPKFRILDDIEGSILREEIVDHIFENRYKRNDKGFQNLIEAYSSSKSDDKLKDIILSIFKFIMSGPYPEQWLEEEVENFNISSLEELNESKWTKVILKYLAIEIQGLINMALKASSICNETEGLEPYIDNFNLDLEELHSLINSLDGGIKGAYECILNFKFSKLKTVRKANVSDEEAQATVKRIRDDVKKSIKKISEDYFALSPEEMVSSINLSYPYMTSLKEVILDFIREYSLAKKGKGTIDFNDLEHLCLKILNSNNGEISKKYKENFNEVLVDEYQDSNDVQEEIINLVSRKNDENPNVFMVGDIKQSIYRFRQAKPELFLEKYRSYSKSQGNNIKIQLYKNFRSRDEVLKGVNFIFKTIMSREVGELEYTDEEGLNLGASFKDNNEENVIVGGEVEVNILNKASEIDTDIMDTEDINDILLEARIVSKRIRELLDGKDGVFYKVVDKATGEYRRVKYKDIVILLRATKNWAQVFLDELTLNNIPVYADTGSGYFESIEIKTIISLLKVIDNPYQDIDLIALLRSSIFKFSDEELAEIRLVNQKNMFYENIKFIIEEENIKNSILIEKVMYFNKKLSMWREKSLYTPIDEFIWYLYSDTGYYGYVGAMPNGVLRQANLKILFQRAREYESTSFSGVFNFVNYMDKVRNTSGDMGSAKILSENEDVVRIMSIHKSKGLEFPIVFLSGAGKGFNLMDLNNSIIYHNDLGLAPDYVNLEKRNSYPTLAKSAVRQKIKIETLSEELRILYVAFTRAKEKLIITGAVRNIDKFKEKSVAAASIGKNTILPSSIIKGKSYLDWIGMSLCKHKDGDIFRENNSDIELLQDLSTFNIKIWDKNQLFVDKPLESVDKNLEKGIDNPSENNILDKEIERRLNFEYKYKEISKIKSNFSVSELKKDSNKEENITEVEELIKSEVKENMPKFLKEERGLSPAEKGTALHLVMEKMNLDKVNSLEDIKAQVLELYNKELLSEAEYRSINCYKVLTFYKSNLGKEILNVHNNEGKVYTELPFFTDIDVNEINSSISKGLDKVRLQGIIDGFFIKDNKVTLFDYKTDFIEEGKEKEFVEKYKLQLMYYKDALEKITGLEVTQCYLYSFYLEKEILC